MMKEIFKNTLLTGIGLAVVTKEKAKKYAEDFIKTNQLSQDEGKKFVDDIMGKVDESKDALKTYVCSTINEMIKRQNIVTNDKLEEYEEKLAKLEERIKALEEK